MLSSSALVASMNVTLCFRRVEAMAIYCFGERIWHCRNLTWTGFPDGIVLRLFKGISGLEIISPHCSSLTTTQQRNESISDFENWQPLEAHGCSDWWTSTFDSDLGCTYALGLALLIEQGCRDDQFADISCSSKWRKNLMRTANVKLAWNAVFLRWENCRS